MYNDTQIVERSQFNDINGAHNLGVETNEINRSLFKLLATPENYPINQLYIHMHWKFRLVIDRIAKEGEKAFKYVSIP